MSGNGDEGSRNLRQCFWAWSGQEGTRSLTRAGLMKTITAAVIDGDAASVCTALLIAVELERTPLKLKRVTSTLPGTCK